MTTGYESATTRLTQQELGACALIQDLLPLYMDDEVSPGSRELIAEHLARCERCAGFLAGARSMHAQLRREGAVRASLAAQDQATRYAVDLGRRRLRWLVVGGICALFGFGLLVGMALLLLGKSSGYATTAPVPAIRDNAPFDQTQPGMPIDPPAPEAPIPPPIDPQMGLPAQAIPVMPQLRSPDALPTPTLVPTPQTP